MKPSFSPWLPYGALILIAIAVLGYTRFDDRIALWLPRADPAALGPTVDGVVRAMHGDEPAVATVQLGDGSVVDAPVAPGCFVQIGDRVLLGGAEGRERRAFPMPKWSR